MRVRDARDGYLAENGFTVEAYDSPKSTGSIFGIKISVPNPPPHRRAIRLHDLHHVATGFGTDHAGEGEIAAWQARRGLVVAGMYVTAITALNGAIGFGAAPARVWSAWRAAGTGGSLFALDAEYEALLEMRVGALRSLLGIPEQGLAKTVRGLHAHAPVLQSAVG